MAAGAPPLPSTTHAAHAAQPGGSAAALPVKAPPAPAAPPGIHAPNDTGYPRPIQYKHPPLWMAHPLRRPAPPPEAAWGAAPDPGHPTAAMAAGPLASDGAPIAYGIRGHYGQKQPTMPTGAMPSGELVGH